MPSSIIHDEDGDGLYHLFASEISQHCGLHSWESNSQIVHAVSSDLEGTYTRKEVVVRLL